MVLSHPSAPLKQPLSITANRIIDISVEIRPDMPVYAEDLPVTFEPAMDMNNGDWVNVTKVSFNTHTGTHFDALDHVLNNGKKMGHFPLDRYIGPARVIEIDPSVTEIGAEHLAGHNLTGVKRLLVKTKSSRFWVDSPTQFRKDFAAFLPSAAQVIVDAGIELIGIDYLSVELYGSDDLPSHKILMNAGITILEGINLAHVEPKDYTLVALPLKLDSLDGTPGRVVLLD